MAVKKWSWILSTGESPLFFAVRWGFMKVLLFDNFCASYPFIEAHIAMFKTKFKTLERINNF